MKIKYWNAVLKEKNSTFQPSGGTEIDCVLKENTSLMNPVFVLTHNINTPIRYVYWVGTLRYYFVSDVVSISNTVIEVHCSIDVLATYKTYIGQSSQYVLRSASANNPAIIDNYYPMSTNVSVTFADEHDGFAFETDLTQGRYVLGVIGRGTGSGMGGAVTYYVLTNDEIRDLNEYLLKDIDLDIDDISDGLAKALCNPTEYIVSCMWYPFITPPIYGQLYYTNKIEVGWWEFEKSGAEFGLLYKDPNWIKDIQFRIPKHPMTNTRGLWLNSSPYTKLIMNCGAFGSIELDPRAFINQVWVSAKIVVDCITGTGHLVVYIDDAQGAISAVYAERYAQIGVPVQIGQNTMSQGSINGLTTSIGSTLIGAVTANPVMLGGGVTGAIGSAINATVPTASSVASNGSLSGFTEGFQLVGEFMLPVDEDIINKGRPLCSVRTINTLSGFIVVENPHIDSYALDEEREMIDAFMRNGFYYE